MMENNRVHTFAESEIWRSPLELLERLHGILKYCPCRAGQGGYPWHLLDWCSELTEALPLSICGEISPASFTPGLRCLGEASVIMPGCVIEGSVYIGKNCRIGPNAFIRGNTVVGDSCIVGHAVEVKNCVISDGSCLSHLSYAGDSLIGKNVNIAAGCVLSNFRHDGGEHAMYLSGKRIMTGRAKLGCILGDGVRLGANSVILPGRILSPSQTTFPNEVLIKNK